MGVRVCKEQIGCITETVLIDISTNIVRPVVVIEDVICPIIITIEEGVVCKDVPLDVIIVGICKEIDAILIVAAGVVGKDIETGYSDEYAIVVTVECIIDHGVGVGSDEEDSIVIAAAGII